MWTIDGSFCKFLQLVEILPSSLVLFILRKLPPRRGITQYHPIHWFLDYMLISPWLNFIARTSLAFDSWCSIIQKFAGKRTAKMASYQGCNVGQRFCLLVVSMWKVGTMLCKVCMAIVFVITIHFVGLTLTSPSYEYSAFFGALSLKLHWCDLSWITWASVQFYT